MTLPDSIERELVGIEGVYAAAGGGVWMFRLRALRAAIEAELQRLTRECDALRASDVLYHDLLFAVGQKWPSETRHQTALRYIRERETPVHGPGQAARPDEATTP